MTSCVTKPNVDAGMYMDYFVRQDTTQDLSLTCHFIIALRNKYHLVFRENYYPIILLMFIDFSLTQLSTILILVKRTLTYVEIKNQIKPLRHWNGSRINPNRYPLRIAAT